VRVLPLARSDKKWYLYAARVSLRCGVLPPQRNRPLRVFKQRQRYRRRPALCKPARFIHCGRLQPVQPAV